jgi:hypothetical protein
MKKESYREFVAGLVLFDGNIDEGVFKKSTQVICLSAKDDGFELVALTVKGKRTVLCTEKYKNRLIAAKVKPSQRELEFTKTETGWFKVSTANGQSSPQPNKLHTLLVEEETNPRSKKKKIALSVSRFK